MDAAILGFLKTGANTSCNRKAIYRAVTFKGMVYEFDRITTPGYKNRIDHDELYLDPGLIYIAHD